MNKEIEALIKDLERRFDLIMGMEIEDLENPLFYSAVNGYMEATKRAIHISPKFHAFDHAEHDKFEEEVCQKIKNDKSIPEQERDLRVLRMFEYYFAPMYDTLGDIGKRIKEQQGQEYIRFARSMRGRNYREYLRQIHPTIIAVLEKELATEALKPTHKLSFNDEDGTLFVDGEIIKIDLKNDLTNGHYILRYIFHNPEGLNAQSFYSEIEFDFSHSPITGDAWRKWYRACGDIQEKVRGGTVSKIDDFLKFSTGVKGSVQINSQYIDSVISP